MHYNRYQPIDTIRATVHFIETRYKLARMTHERCLISENPSLNICSAKQEDRGINLLILLILFNLPPPVLFHFYVSVSVKTAFYGSGAVVK